jgi:hypothetical protein
MKQERTYNIPAALLDAYENRRVILRGPDPAALAEILSSGRHHSVVSLQLLDVSADLEALSRLGYGSPIEVVLKDPEVEAAKLYRVTRLQRTHPVRIVIPAVAGLSKAVKVASSLRFPIKIEGTQPDPAVIEELCQTLDLFLHDRAVSQPIDYFSGLLTALLHRLPITAWDIQEEDPAMLRYVTDDGHETIARRPFIAGADLDSFHVVFTERVLSDGAECASCRFFTSCGGYFKWPDQNYSCDGIKQIFQKLQDAVHELDDDLTLNSRFTMESTR